MTGQAPWRASYQGPHGIDTTFDAPDWTSGADHLRGLCEASRPEGVYEVIVAGFKRAVSRETLSLGDARHRFTLTPSDDAPRQTTLF